MQAALDVSWRRLSEEQKRAFQELTIFRGGFTREAALEVAGATLPVLVTMVNKSWLAYSRQRDRYHIHELLRQYGAARLGADPDREQAVRDRHSAYFCNFLHVREMDWVGPEQLDAANDVQFEIENIHRAWRWAAARGKCDLLAQGQHSLRHFYDWEGRKSDGLRMSHAAGEGLAAAIAGERVDLAPCLALRSRIMAWEAGYIEEVVERESVLAKSEQILARAAQLGWDTRAEEAEIRLGKVYAAGNQDRSLAIEEGRRALALFQEVGNRWGQAETSRVMGVNYLFLGAFAEAKRRLGESLAILEELDDKRNIAKTTTDLGLVAQHQGNYEEAETLHRQGLKLHRELRNRHYESYTFTVLSFTHSWAGNFEAAHESARLSVGMHREISDVPELWGLIALTMAVFHLGDYVQAAHMAAEALEIADQRGHLLEKAFALLFLGDIAIIDGELDTATDYLSESAVLMAVVGYVYQALPQANLSLAARAQGDGEKAREALASAVRSSLEYRSTTPLMYCLPAAALLAADVGDRARSMALYGLAQRFGHIMNSRWFEDAACRELEAVRDSMPPDLAAEAVARGREMEVWESARNL